MVLAVMCVGYFLVLLDVTVLNVAVPAIGAGLGVGVTGLQWVVNGYALALAALLLVGGALGDAYGHRRVVLAGLALFGAASAGCGLAPTVGVLVAARVLQGVGAALLLPGTLAIITRAFPEPAAQARAIGVWAGVGSVALPARTRCSAAGWWRRGAGARCSWSTCRSCWWPRSSRCGPSAATGSTAAAPTWSGWAARCSVCCAGPRSPWPTRSPRR